MRSTTRTRSADTGRLELAGGTSWSVPDDRMPEFAGQQDEPVFVIDGYNRGGYSLCTSDFSHNATFRFSYH